MNAQNSFYLDPSLQRQLEALISYNLLDYVDQLSAESNNPVRECVGSCKGGCSCENGGTMTIG